MGNQSSSPLLVPQVHFPHFLSSRYTRTDIVTLRLEPCFWSHSHPEPLEIRNVATNLTMFRIPTSSNHKTNSKRLLDMYNAPVATMATTEHIDRTTTTTILSAASHHHHGLERTLCTVETKLLDDYGRFVTYTVWGDHTTITCEGDWSRPHNISFWLEDKQHHRHERYYHRGGSVRIAHIHSNPEKIDSDASYLLEIAPGVDVALVLLICAAIDDAAAFASPRYTHHNGTAVMKRSSCMEIVKPLRRRSDAVAVPV